MYGPSFKEDEEKLSTLFMADPNTTPKAPKSAKYVIAGEGSDRSIKAGKDVSVGEAIFTERPFAWVPLAPSFHMSTCFTCGKLEVPKEQMSTCSCEQVSYCSKKCAEEDVAHKEFECKIYSQLGLIAKVSATDVNLIRLVVRIIRERYTQYTAELAQQKDSSKVTLPRYQELTSLVTHRHNFGTEWLESVTKALTYCLNEMPVEAKISIDEAVDIACRINSNSHGLESDSGDFGLGLFPTVPLFNHACSPNVFFYPAVQGHGALRISVIAPIAQNEEMCVSYIDQYMSREERQKILKETKFFDCACKRCSEPWTTTAIDSLVEGFVCHLTPGCKGLIVPKSFGNWSCTECDGAVQEVKVLERYKEILMLMSKANYAASTKKYHDVKDIVGSIMSQFATPGKGSTMLQLNPHHYIVFKCNYLLMNATTSNKDYLGVIRYAKALISNYKMVTPSYHMELANVYAHLVYAYDSALSSGKGGKSTNEYKTHREEALKKAIEIKKVCLGETHHEVSVLTQKLTKK